jgi:hypothetical protein
MNFLINLHKKMQENKWIVIDSIRNIFAVLVVWTAAFLNFEPAKNLVLFINFLLFFILSCFFFYKNGLINYLKFEKNKNNKIIYFSRLCWWFCILIFASKGWTVSAIIWFSAWFIIFNLKKNISIYGTKQFKSRKKQLY